MINLHERLSEFSYGYGVTREVERRLAAAGLRATPFLPSLLHEASVGFDVAFSGPGQVVMLQFKLGQELSRFRRLHPGETIPLLQRPFWLLCRHGRTSVPAPRGLREPRRRRVLRRATLLPLVDLRDGVPRE